METSALKFPTNVLLSNILVRLLSFCVLVFLSRFAYVVTVKSHSCDSIDFCDPSSVKSTSESANRRRTYYFSVFQDLVTEGVLSANSNSNSLCIEALGGEEALALREIGVFKSVRVSSKKLTSEGLRRFRNSTFDFEFSSAAGLDRAAKPVQFASEVSRKLKPGGFFVVHTESFVDEYSIRSLMRLFGNFTLVKLREINGLDSLAIREIILRKQNVTVNHVKREKSHVKGKSGNSCVVPRYKRELIRNAEPLIQEEPLKPWITLKRNIKNVKYLSGMVDISFKNRYIYIDVGARSYGSSIVSWFRKQYPKHEKPFEVYAVEADNAFHNEYKAKKGVTMLPYAAWIRNETLIYKISREPSKKNVEKGRGMGMNQAVLSSSNFMDVNKIEGFDFALWLKSVVTEMDYVVVKMDVEGTEFNLIPRLIETRAICSIDRCFSNATIIDGRGAARGREVPSIRRHMLNVWNCFHLLEREEFLCTMVVMNGLYGQEMMVCQYIQRTNSQGSTWFGRDPFSYTVPLLLAQISIIFIITSLIWLLIRPCKQGLISAQLIGGIIMGQSFLGRIKAYREHLFPPGGRQILETSADLGFILYLFILGVHIDLNLVKKVERYAVVIGGLNFVVPLMSGFLGVYVVNKSFELDSTAKQSLPFIASLTAMSSFPVITSLLADLNILNSEIGRIATLASLVSDIFNYTLSMIIGAIGMYLISLQLAVVMSAVGAVVFLLIILFILRPVITCVARRIPEGQQMKESHFVVISVMVLICALGSEILGQPAGLGTFILGVVVPDAAGLGSSLVSRLDAFSTGLLVPAKFVISGLSLDMFSIRAVSGGAYLVVLLMGYSAKFLVVFVTSLYYKIPTRDAVALALVLCCKGAIEAALYITLFEDGMLGKDAYAVLLISMLMVTGIARPLITFLYDPSSRYLGLCKNSIMLNQPNDELRMLLCIHNADNVPTMINLLDASTPMRDRPITLFALSLMELKGRGAAILEQTDRKSKLTTSRSWSNQAANAINSFAERNQGSVVVRHFTSVAPYPSMHDDVCTLAADQVTNIVIAPFHKQYTTDSTVASNSPSLRLVNQNVMAKSPCSVGILIDRGQITAPQYAQRGSYHICLLFLGGLDDCEALAYCTRFIHNHILTFTFVWIRPWDHVKYAQQTESSMEMEMVNQFRAKTIGIERVIYKEELVKDAIGTTRVIGSLKDYDIDLCVVGRYHDPDSEILAGINEWSECPELGIIGDMLATPDFQFSVLVVQQQPPGMDFGTDAALQTVASGYISSSRYSDCKDDFDSFHRV